MSSFQIRKFEGPKMLYMLYAFKSVINTYNAPLHGSK